ncbi:MAG: energy transducer TonB [Candidatus Saccharimonadales bacterium]
MIISKFDLYKPEWLELVFDNRNKAYGAYYLRQHYAKNMVMAMGATFLGIGLLFGAGAIFSGRHIVPVIQIPHDPLIIIHLSELKQPVAPPKRTEQPKPVTPPKTTVFTPFVVKPDPVITTPAPVIAQITGAIGQTTSKGKAGPVNVLPVTIPGTGTVTAPAPDNTVHPPFGLDVMPAPVGGDKAWAKFLNRNLRFPGEAQQDGASGRVILSFIVEKDGTLSNITVDRPAGHGFDEEALRVLKLAKAWKPGMQNGQPVRVKFEIPINFQLSSDQP